MTDIPVPFFRPSVGADEIAGVSECLKSGWLTTGPVTRSFEEDFVAMLGGGVEALAVTSATAALHLGLEALGVRSGDEVILPTMTFTATAEVVRYMDATPVLVDIDRSTLCIDPDAVEAAITPRTKVIMPVHFAGRACDMTRLRAIADARGLKILDDAAHALPAAHAGSVIGTAFADATAFSFYANKTMTTGEGGMLVTPDPEIAKRARTMRLHGIDRDVFNRFSDVRASWIYDVVAPGFKYNMTDVAAAMGRVQLRKIDAFRETRAKLAARYDAAFADLPLVLPPHAAKGDQHSWHLYIVQLSADAPLDRAAFVEALKARNIATSVHYRPLHQMTYWSGSAKGGPFPEADAYFDACVSLPLFMDMSDAEQDAVITVVSDCLTA